MYIRYGIYFLNFFNHDLEDEEPKYMIEATGSKYGRDPPYFDGLFLDGFRTCDRVGKYGCSKGKRYGEMPVAIKRGEAKYINMFAVI